MHDSEKSVSITAQAVKESVQSVILNGTWRAYHGAKLQAPIGWFHQYANCEFVRLCSSGTLAVELALRSLKLQPDDEVILSAYDFPGNFRAIEDAGGKVSLCDPKESDGWILRPETIERIVAPKSRAIIVSHLHGQLAPMRAIIEWANGRGIFVIEDACQALGAIVDGRAAGSWGHLGVFSLGGSKLVSAGRGGIVVTNDPILSQRMTVYCERGNDAYALSEIQAALALPQCERLREDHEVRFQAARLIIDGLNKYPWLRTFVETETQSPAFYKLGLECLFDATSGLTRDWLVSQLALRGVEVGVGFIGFGNRSSKRFRSVQTLDRSKQLAKNTLLIHHSMLLDPHSGESKGKLVLNALDEIAQEIY